jgi:NAD(P)-dependent dehydrogenase (short-subunit alcohol dehydrogenase family)
MEGGLRVSWSVAGKRVLVTGASTGIGAAVARELASAGCTVGICARRGDLLAEVLADLRVTSPESRSWVVDLADLDGVAPFAARAEEELGGVDILVNNAGMPKRRHSLSTTAEEVDQVMSLNYLSPVRLILALMPGMVARGEGRIVNVSSVAARFGPPREAAYSASKAAISAFSESLAVDLAGSGVTVHLVNPGIIDTDLFHLPDNEPSLGNLPPERPADLARAMREQLEEGTFELWFPGWMKDVMVTKVQDPDGFLAGSVEFTAQRVKEMGLADPFGDRQ